MTDSDDGEGTVVEEDPEMEEDEQEKETSGSEENEVVMMDEEQKEEERLEGEEDLKSNEKLKTGGDAPVDDPNQTEDAMDPVPGELNQDMPEMEPEVQKESKATDEQTDAGSTKHTEVEAEMVDTRFVTSHHNQVAACDIVS